MRTELSLYVDGSRFKCEQYGNIKNAEKIVLFCHGFPGSNRLVSLKDILKNGYSDHSPHYNQSQQLSAQPPKN